MTLSAPLLRWVWQSVLRDRRQYFLVVWLSALSVASITLAVLFVDQLSVSPSVRYGTATHTIYVGDYPDQPLVDVVASAEQIFDDPQIVYQSPTVRFPGASAEPFVLDQIPGEPFGGSPPEVVAGRLPSAPAELAISPRVRAYFSDIGIDADVGSYLDWGGETFKVVGMVEDPTDPNSDFFLVAAGTIKNPASAMIVVDASEEQFAEFSAMYLSLGWEDFAVTATSDALDIVFVYLAAIVAMLVVGLLSSAGFYVMHRRSARNYAILASLGATPRQLRRSMVLTGAVVGLVGGIIGATIGLGVFVATRPMIEGIVGHKFALNQISPVVIIPAILLCVATTVAASLAPARTISAATLRSVLQPSVHHRVSRSTAFAAAAAVGGLIALRFGTIFTLPIAAVAFIIAAFFLLPLIVRVLAAGLEGFGIGWRITGGELARSRSRTVMSISALMITATVTGSVGLVAAARDRHTAAQPPNLPDNVVLIRRDDYPTYVSGDNNDTPDAVVRIAESAPNSRLVPLLAPVNADESLVQVLQEVDVLVDGTPGVELVEYQPWIATPELLAAFGADPNDADLNVDVLATRLTPVGLGYWNPTSDVDRTEPEPLGAEYGSAPPTWITRHGVETHGYDEQVIGWVLVSPGPLTNHDTNPMYALAGTDFRVEPRIVEPTPAPVGTIGSILGAVISLVMTASLVALIASESRRDYITLNAVGASRDVTRRLAARTALILSGTAAILALPLSYFLLRAVVAGVGQFPATLSAAVIVTNLVVIPAAATAFSYLTGGSRVVSHRQLLD